MLAASLHLGTSYAAPLLKTAVQDVSPKVANDPRMWAFLGTGIGLVLLGGAFAGLTIAYSPLFTTIQLPCSRSAG